MKKVIVSKEKCLGCLYGISGVCEMYDDKPMDGETCSNYEQAGENEMVEGQQYVNIAPQLDEMSRLRCYQLGIMHGANTLIKQIWHKESEHPDNRHPYLVLNPNGKMAFAFYDELYSWQFDREFKHNTNMLWLDIERILPKEN